jgi:D-sedoheptulose 7-phosphate isomerase
MKYFINSINESIKLKKKLKNFNLEVNFFTSLIFDTVKKNKKIFICGNGGSAADSQHLAAEFLVRLNPKVNRKALAMIPLALDSSSLTACGNDYSFDKIFSRNLEAIGSADDLLICLTTSGNSKNIINVIKIAKKMKIKTLCLLGNKGGSVKNLIKEKNNMIIIPSKNVARIQECHMFLGHTILNMVENKLLKNKII